MKKFWSITIALALAISMTLIAFTLTTPAANAETNAPISNVTENNEIVADATNDVAENNEIVADATNAVAENNEIVADATHVCVLDRANVDYHRYSCEECDNYSRVYHNADTMTVLIKNEFFHLYSCATCGYEYAENHNFSTSYNSEYHQEVCVDCGYATVPEAHIMVNDFYGNYHDIQCDFCGYMSEHHVGAKYEAVDQTNCKATCRCGVVETIEHDWDGFVCDNCDYVMSGDTYAIVGRISKNEDDYRVRFNDISGTHRIDMWDISELKEGDFVRINHYGNDIFDITVLVDGNIVNDEENFANYILSDEINEISEDLTFEDLVIEEFEYSEDCLDITFESGRSTIFCNFSEFVFYDLMDGGIGEIEECYAYLTMYVGDTAYFICFW